VPEKSSRNLFEKLKGLDTEQQNPDTVDIDLADEHEIVNIINREDQTVAHQIGKKSQEIARAIKVVYTHLADGGRLIYVGAGTSGRLGVLDAAECPPTFGTPHDLISGIIAGGKEAMFKAQEGAEDSEQKGAEALQNKNITSRDVVCGLAASGRTPFVLGAIKQARQLHCKTIFVCTVPRSQLEVRADVIIDIPVGPEVIMGSTRMKSATAQKMVLNMITTGAMIKQGKVFGNVMVDLQATNQKLEERCKRIIMMLTDLSYDESKKLLAKAHGHVKTALVMYFTSTERDKAQSLLESHNGFIRRVLQHYEES